MTAESGSLLQSDSDLPTLKASNARIATDAPAALAYLRRRGALDVAEALGLGGVA
jgi:hypothetical protein